MSLSNAESDNDVPLGAAQGQDMQTYVDNANRYDEQAQKKNS